MGDYSAAAEQYRKAIQHTEELRAGLDPVQRAEFYNVRIKGFYRTAPYEGLARVLIRLNEPLDAFRQSEYTKARMFAEGISMRAAGSVPEVPKDVLETDSRLNDELAALTKNLQKASEKQDKEAIASLEPQVTQARERLAAHVNMLRKQHPLFAATKYPQPMDLSQTDLKDNEWVIAYHVTDPGVIVYLTRGKNLVKAQFKPIPRKEIDDLVRLFRASFDMVGGKISAEALAKFDFSAGNRLADILLRRPLRSAQRCGGHYYPGRLPGSSAI